jgi:hypothetical protein
MAEIAAHNSPGSLVSILKKRIFSLTSVVLVLSVIGSLLITLILVQTNGNLFVVLALISSLLIVGVTFYRVDWGFYVFLFFIFFFDQFGPPGFQSVTSMVGYFLNLNAISWLPSFDQGVVTPMELQLVFLFFVWLLVAAIRQSLSIVRIPLKSPALLFALTLITWIIYGKSAGGDFVVALWETRAFFYLIIMLFFVPQIIRTKEQIHSLLWVCIAGITIKAVQGAIRYAENGFSFGWWPNIVDTYTNHEDPVFMITLFLLLIALTVFRAPTKQKGALLWLLLPLMLGFQSAQRRATYASFMASMLAFIVLLPKEQRNRVLRATVSGAIVFAIYLGAFWNVNSKVGALAQQFKATVTDSEGVRGDKDKESDYYRDAENYNLGFTYRAVPIAGVGFGNPYLTPARMWGVQVLALGKYIPHNQILWIFVEMGVIGGIVFWLFLNSFVFYATVVFRRLTDPYFKAVCTICIVQVINQCVVSYVDMQLTYYRNMTYLGILMGLVVVIDRLDKEKHQVADVAQPT